MASTQVIRVTVFKLGEKEDQEAMVKNYQELWKTADGKPYIWSLEVGPTSDDSNPNFNFVGKSIFKSVEDMLFYQNDCPAHMVLKAKVASELEIQGIMTVYFTPAFSESV